MERRRKLVGVLALVTMLLGSGCMGQTRVAKLQEAAANMNTATRFGRMDVALEHVSAETAEDFADRHAAWGSALRIVDIEFQGMKFVDKNKAVVFVAVGWQRVDAQELRVTHVGQVWEYDHGWKLVDESRMSGDVGLLGESVIYMDPGPRPDAHFPSTTIR